MIVSNIAFVLHRARPQYAMYCGQSTKLFYGHGTCIYAIVVYAYMIARSQEHGLCVCAGGRLGFRKCFGNRNEETQTHNDYDRRLGERRRQGDASIEPQD